MVNRRHLILPSTNDPYACATFAAYTDAAELVFDPSSTVPILEINDVKQAASVDEILLALTSAQDAYTSAEVCLFFQYYPGTRHLIVVFICPGATFLCILEIPIRACVF